MSEEEQQSPENQEPEEQPEQAADEQAPEQEVEAEAAAEEDVPKEESAKEEAPKEEAPKEEAPKEEAPESVEAEAADEAPAAKRPQSKKKQKSGKDKAEKEVVPGAHLEPDIGPRETEDDDVFARYAADEEPEGEPTAEGEESSEPDEAVADLPHKARKLEADARFIATGKRKSSVARVILKRGKGKIEVNGHTLEEAFPRVTLQNLVRQPLETSGYGDQVDITARIHGGGVAGQAGALRHGIARAIIEADPELRVPLKRRGLLTRDPRVKERRKAGLKKARKRPQFSKR